MQVGVQDDSQQIKETVKGNETDLDKTVDFLRNIWEEHALECFDRKLSQSIETLDHLAFSVTIVSDTAAGKSMFINALLAKRMLLSKKGGCTTAVTEILNSDNDCFHVVAYDKNGAVKKESMHPIYEMMMECNADKQIRKITVEGKIPFWEEESMALSIVDTPNIRKAELEDYNKIIDRAVNGDDNQLLIYVFDGAQLCENMPILKYIAGKMKKGKQRDNPILFVINKVDLFYSEGRDIQEVILSVKKCLLSYGIKNSQIIPCSAFLAIGIKEYFRHQEVKKLNKAQKKRLRWVARDTLHLLEQVMEHQDIYFEQYVMLQDDAHKQLEKRLNEAEKQKDIKTQALIYSGICSIETAIVERMKYYEQKKKKEFVKAFYAYYRKFIDADPCSILVTATMSAGKSTFINALAGEDICLSQNMACTTKVQPIIGKLFDIEVELPFDSDLAALMNQEERKDVKIVYFNGLLGGQRLVVYDSPGVNYSEDSKHKKITDNIIRTGNYQMMVYLMNATQLGTNDDDAHLTYVKKHAGKKIILFIMNKIDAFNEEEEEIETAVLKQVAYLKSKGFRNPLVCPVSAKAGYLAKKSQREPLSRLERRELNCMEDKFAQMKLVDYYHKYYPDIKIEDSENEDIQLLKTCGISYVEAIIKIMNKGGCVNGTSIR